MLGRFQPFHDGHLALFEKCHEQTGQVVIMVRDTPRGIKDPFDFKTVKQNIQLYLLGEGYEENHDYIIMKVPNIVDISYGRDVGYTITQHKFDKDVEDISATEIRRQIGIEKS
jgi:cytidyltransferase-like protein